MIYGLTYNYACCCFWEIFSLTEFTQFLKYPWQLYPRSPPHASDFSRLNRAFFLGLNSICRRFRFIVQFSFLKTSKSQHFFQQGPIIRRQFEMPEKCAKSALQILLCFLPTRSNAQPAQEHYWVRNSCICSEIEIHCMWSRVIEYVAYFAGSGLVSQTDREDNARFIWSHIVSDVQHQGFLQFPNFVRQLDWPSSTRGSRGFSQIWPEVREIF